MSDISILEQQLRDLSAKVRKMESDRVTDEQIDKILRAGFKSHWADDCMVSYDLHAEYVRPLARAALEAE